MELTSLHCIVYLIVVTKQSLFIVMLLLVCERSVIAECGVGGGDGVTETDDVVTVLHYTPGRVTRTHSYHCWKLTFTSGHSIIIIFQDKDKLLS